MLRRAKAKRKQKEAEEALANKRTVNYEKSKDYLSLYFLYAMTK